MGPNPLDEADPDTNFDCRRALVTGGAGFLGTRVIRHLQEHGYSVAILDDGSAGTLQRLEQLAVDPNLTAHQIDLRDRSAVAAVCIAERPSYVVHLAGRHFIPECEALPDETWQVNVEGTRNLLAGLSTEPPLRFVFASTADLYRESLAPHQEDDPLRPPTVYGRSKLAAEELVLQAVGEWGTGAIVARLFNLYGPHHTVEHLIPTIVTQASRGERLTLGKLSTFRDYVHVDDAARALTSLLTAGVTGIFNIGTGIGTAGEDLVQLVGKLLDRELIVTLDPRRLRRYNRKMLVAEPAKLRAQLPWWPAIQLVQGMQGLISMAVKSSAQDGDDARRGDGVDRG